MTTDGYLLDVNVVLALAWPQHLHHARSHAWFEVEGRDWATTPITEMGLVRLLTTRAVVDADVSADQALATLAGIRRAPGHRFLPDDSSLADPDIALIRLAGRHAVTDLHLVNLSARHSIRLATLDSRLPELLEPADRRHVLVLP